MSSTERRKGKEVTMREQVKKRMGFLEDILKHLDVLVWLELICVYYMEYV